MKLVMRLYDHGPRSLSIQFPRKPQEPVRRGQRNSDSLIHVSHVQVNRPKRGRFAPSQTSRVTTGQRDRCATFITSRQVKSLRSRELGGARLWRTLSSLDKDYVMHVHKASQRIKAKWVPRLCTEHKDTILSSNYRKSLDLRFQ